MFKKWMMALAPAVMVTGSVFAGDDVLDQFQGVDVAAIRDATVELTEIDLDSSELESMVESGIDAEQVDAIEAAFRGMGYGRGRSFGYGFGGYGFRGYGYGGFRHSGGYHCGVSRSVYYHRPIYHCPPVYHCSPVIYTPTYGGYWGCY